MDEPILEPTLHCGGELWTPHGEELRALVGSGTVVEGDGSHPPTGTAALVDHGYFMAGGAEPPCCGQPGHARPDHQDAHRRSPQEAVRSSSSLMASSVVRMPLRLVLPRVQPNSVQ